MIRRLRREAAEHDPCYPARRFLYFCRHCADRNARGPLGREGVDTGRNRRKCNGAEAMLRRKVERRAIAGGQELILALLATAPHRADCMDDVLRFEPIPARDLCRAGFAAAQRLAFALELWSRGAMDCAVNAAAPK